MRPRPGSSIQRSYSSSVFRLALISCRSSADEWRCGNSALNCPCHKNEGDLIASVCSPPNQPWDHRQKEPETGGDSADFLRARAPYQPLVGLYCAHTMPQPINLQEFFGEIDIYLFDQLLKARFVPGMRVLDAGCGSG